MNQYGKLLLGLLERSHLLALNDHYIGDLNGRLTCTRYNGRSCGGVGIVNKELLSDVTYFRVLDSTIFSDHNPICVSIKCNLKNSLMDKLKCVMIVSLMKMFSTIGLLILK